MHKEAAIKTVKLLFMPQSKPILVGVYENSSLIEEIKGDDIASDFIPKTLKLLSDKYKISSIIYANGPGSFTGIKVAYIALRVFALARDIEMFAVSGFELNSHQPIRANNKFSFVQKDGEIILAKATPGVFKLPPNLSTLKLNDDILPNYIIDAV